MNRIVFADEKTIEVEVPAGSLLEVALRHGIAMPHACGGVARCTTCRVEVLEHSEHLSPPGDAEARFAEAWGLPEGVRLACRAQVAGDVTVRRLVREAGEGEAVPALPSAASGREIEMAVLFADLQAFTAFTARHPPHDVMHILDVVFRRLGEPIVRNNGFIHQYYGDGIMGLFGFYSRDARRTCREAVIAAMEMHEALHAYNAELERNFGDRLRMGTGIHFGEVITGKLGHARHRQLTVVGDVVNVANRVQRTTKLARTPIVISREVYRHLGPEVVQATPFHVRLKGKSGTHRLYELNGLEERFARAPISAGVAPPFGVVSPRLRRTASDAAEGDEPDTP